MGYQGTDGLGEVRRMTRSERLDRWATVLEEQQGRPLRALQDLEFFSRPERHAMRENNSPLSAALTDPALRRQGLESDRYEEAGKFFGLSDWSAHYILCHCHYGLSRDIAPEVVARRVRAAARQARLWEWTLPEIRLPKLPELRLPQLVPGAAAFAAAALVVAIVI